MTPRQRNALTALHKSDRNLIATTLWQGSMCYAVANTRQVFYKDQWGIVCKEVRDLQRRLALEQGPFNVDWTDQVGEDGCP